MQNKNTETLLAFRDIVDVLIENSTLLSFDEKKEFKGLTPMLDMGELLELFRLLVNSKENSDKILNDLARMYPDVVRELDQHQVSTLKNLFKTERDVLKTNIIKTNIDAGKRI